MTADAVARLRACDFVRAGSAEGIKEWTHFYVFGNDDQPSLLVNFSLTDRVQTARLTGKRVARLTMVATLGDTAVGTIDRFDSSDCVIGPTGHAMRFGASSVELDADGYRVQCHSDDGRLTADVHFEPVGASMLTPAAPMGTGSVRWLLAPRMLARGWLAIDGVRYRVAASAYHDHNWGSFRWGDDFCWHWAIAHAQRTSTPWSFVLSRVLDAAQHCSFSKGLIVGDGRFLTDFRGDEVTVSRRGVFDANPALRLPGAIALAVPGRGTDVPAALTVHAQNGRGTVEMAIEPRSYIQIGIPTDDGRFGVALLTEVEANMCAAGSVNGVDFDVSGQCLLELTGVVA